VTNGGVGEISNISGAGRIVLAAKCWHLRTQAVFYLHTGEYLRR